jgi:hypothetical protein
MRTTSLVTGYLQAAVFIALAIRALLAWSRQRDTSSAHLAWATGVYGINSLVSAISQTVFDSSKAMPSVAPHWLQALMGALGFVAIYAFLVFLWDFVPFPQWLRAFFGIATVAWIVIGIFESIGIRRIGPNTLVLVPGPHNPISLQKYIGAVLAYYAVVYGILWITFVVNGFRLQGLARARMLCIGAGFLLLFVVIGLLPRLFFGKVIRIGTFENNLLIAAAYIGLAAAPLLFLGFTPPKWLARGYATAQ